MLHILIICDTLVHTRIARILLKCYPRLAIDVIEGDEYLGKRIHSVLNETKVMELLTYWLGMFAFQEPQVCTWQLHMEMMSLLKR